MNASFWLSSESSKQRKSREQQQTRKGLLACLRCLAREKRGGRAACRLGTCLIGGGGLVADEGGLAKQQRRASLGLPQHKAAKKPPVDDARLTEITEASVGPAAATHPEGYTFKLPFDRRCRSSLAVEVPPGEMVYYTIR